MNIQIFRTLLLGLSRPRDHFMRGVLIGIASLRVVGQADITFVNWETAPVHPIGLSLGNRLLAVANLPGAC